MPFYQWFYFPISINRALWSQITEWYLREYSLNTIFYLNSANSVRCYYFDELHLVLFSIFLNDRTLDYYFFSSKYLLFIVFLVTKSTLKDRDSTPAHFIELMAKQNHWLCEHWVKIERFSRFHYDGSFLLYFTWRIP